MGVRQGGSETHEKCLTYAWKMSCCRGMELIIYNSIPLLNHSKKNRQRRGVLPRPIYIYIYIGFSRFWHFEYYRVLLLLEFVTLFLRCRTLKPVKNWQKPIENDPRPLKKPSTHKTVRSRHKQKGWKNTLRRISTRRKLETVLEEDIHTSRRSERSVSRMDATLQRMDATLQN